MQRANHHTQDEHGFRARLAAFQQQADTIYAHNPAPQHTQPLRVSILQIPNHFTLTNTAHVHRPRPKEPKMVKVVVPSHYSRYIVTATDLATYLRSHFGQEYDFQIEVCRQLHSPVPVIHMLTTTDSIPTTFGISKAQQTSQTYVAFDAPVF
ncbi:hypothetical protein diail_8731 [Diaporthe ilicicola]|nr:hypothetical protein diail_8731 [Diaporthe ilicicola]